MFASQLISYPSGLGLTPIVRLSPSPTEIIWLFRRNIGG